MNVNQHYLELFHYVAKYGGLSEASRKMPYGIGPSTLSKQICKLEAELKTKLFERRPFRLTPEGEVLFNAIRAHYEGIPGVLRQIMKGVPAMVQIGGSPVVLRDYMPSILRQLRREFPGLRLVLREGLQWQIEGWLKDELIDLAVTLLEGDMPADYQCEELMRLSLVLLVPKDSPRRSTAELWRQRRIKYTLIGPPADDAISRLFYQGLQRRGIKWPIEIEASSMGLIETYVAEGFGIGISLALPGRKTPAGLRALPLSDFGRVTVGMVWREHPNAATQALIKLLGTGARQMLRSRKVSKRARR